MKFTAVFVEGDSGFVVALVEEIPAIVTQGKTIDDARARVRSAIRIMLEEYREQMAEHTYDRRVLLRETIEVDDDHADA